MSTARITAHPVLGDEASTHIVKFYLDGKEMTGVEGEPIAAALKASGIQVHRYTKKTHAPRGVFCAIGRCTDCVMIVDGIPNVRTCVKLLTEGMRVETQIGAGGKDDEI